MHSTPSGVVKPNISTVIGPKIPALSGREKDNNSLVLREIAFHGPLQKYQIFKRTGIQDYPTVFRRVDSLEERGYILRVGQVKQSKRPGELTWIYGLTWRGLLACLSVDGVSKMFLDILRNNALLDFPLKQEIISILQNDNPFTTQEFEALVREIHKGLMEALPSSIELVPDSGLLYYLYPGGVAGWSRFMYGRDPKSIGDKLQSFLWHPAILSNLRKFRDSYVQQIEDLKKGLEELDKVIEAVKSRVRA